MEVRDEEAVFGRADRQDSGRSGWARHSSNRSQAQRIGADARQPNIVSGPHLYVERHNVSPKKECHLLSFYGGLAQI